MKVAVASEGKTEDSNVSDRGGRAPYYLIFEGDELKDTVDNPFAVGGGGAGWSVAYMMAEKGVEMFIAGRIGGNMETALREKGIKFTEFSGTVKDALASVQ